MPKFERILSFFPAFYRATESYKLLREMVRLMGQPLEEADTHLFRIQRAHRLRVAEHAEDIMRLAALLNLTPFHFEDILTNDAFSYEQKLVLMRDRVQRVAQVHLKGLGTPWAVMQSAAIFLNATIVPEHLGDLLIKHIDKESFSHKAVIEFTHLPEKPRERIYLHENPFCRKKEPLSERWPPQSWAINNESMSGLAPVRFVIQGVANRTVLPSVYCPQTREGILFNGVVPDGSTLLIDEEKGVTLDNMPVDEWLVYFKGGAAGFARADSDNFVQEKAEEAMPFNGDLETITARPYRCRRSIPDAPVGRSDWHFNVTEGIYDGRDYDFAVCALPHLPVGMYDGDFNFDGCVFDYEASSVVGMAWDERIPCALKLLLPSHVPQPQRDEAAPVDETTMKQPNYVGRIGNIIPRFRAAGIRVFADTVLDAWILGESVIRDQDAADGEGANFHTTCLRDQKADILVSLE